MADFTDEPIFAPYAELGLTPGKHQLRTVVNAIRKDGKLISHLTDYDFEYNQSRQVNRGTVGSRQRQ